jgi:uncharacterized protein
VPDIPFRLDPDSCDGCGDCVRACATGALELAGHSVSIDPDRCDGCEDCVLACPTPALTIAPSRPWRDLEKGAAAEASDPEKGAAAAASGERDAAGAPADTTEQGDPSDTPQPPARADAGDSSDLPRAARHARRWRLTDLAVAAAVLLALQLGAGALSGALRLSKARGPIVLAETLVFYALLVGVVEIIARRRKVSQKDLGLAPFRAGRSLPGVLGLIMTELGLMAILLATRAEYVQLVRSFGFRPPSVEKQLLGLFGPGLAGLALAFGVTVVLAPIVEELFFRGFVFGVLKERMPVWLAILLSALIFAVYHFSLWLVVPIVLLGIALAWLAHWQRSIWPAVACHGLNNLLAVLVVYWPAITAAWRHAGG